MEFLGLILLIVFSIYILAAFIRRKWNDFFYGCCIGLLAISDLPIPTYIIFLLLLVLLHSYIEKKELKEKTKLNDKENEY